MGRIRDIYFRWMSTGDEFVGRCASLLSTYRKDFAASPVYFKKSVTHEWVEQNVKEVFPCFFQEFKTGHVARNISILRCTNLDSMGELTTIKFAWDNDHVITGVPPHIRQLVELQLVREQTTNVVENVTTSVMDKVSEYFDQQSIGENLTVERVKAIVASATSQQINRVVTELTTNLSKQIEGLTLALGTSNGRLQRLPNDWRFPEGNPIQLWTQWNVGDNAKQVPPLRSLNAKDFVFLDAIPLSEKEQKELKGRKNNQNKRRASRKTYSEMKSFCQYIEEKAKEAGFDIKDRSLANVRRMYEVAAVEFRKLLGARAREQGRCWRTLVRKLQDKKKAGGREQREQMGQEG